MKKIAVLCAKLCDGGAERFAVNLVNSLSLDNQYTVYLLTGVKKEKEYKLLKPVNRISIISTNKNLFSDAVAIHRFCKKNNIDYLVAINLYPNFVACLANFFLGTKVTITERNAPGFLKLSWKTKLLKKILYWMADSYVFQTEDAKNCYSPKIQNNSVVIQNPIKDNLPYKEILDDKEIVAIGRIESQKNYKCLIKAFKIVARSHPEYVLKIYGEGKLCCELKDFCKEQDLVDNVFFNGFCFDVHEQIKKSQIYVMSSDFEGMPNALMEAMAMGFPVVSTDCPTGGPKAIIKNGINGLLVDVGDYKKMAEAINYLIDNPNIRKQIGDNAKKIRNTNSEDVIISEWKNKVFSSHPQI